MEKLGHGEEYRVSAFHTLEVKGLIERMSNGRSFRKRMRYRIGMLSVSKSISFVSEVERGIDAEAKRAGLEVIVRHHEFRRERVCSRNARPCWRWFVSVSLLQP